MTREFSYKLGRYKITEVIGGGLWWESHHGLGTIQKGKCFIEGSILILGPSEIEGPGFLKREFMEHLHRLSTWDKTKYYCLSHSISECRTGGRISFAKKMEATEEHADASLCAVKVHVRSSADNREIINKRRDSEHGLVYFKEKAGKLWAFFKKWSSKGRL